MCSSGWSTWSRSPIIVLYYFYMVPKNGQMLSALYHIPRRLQYKLILVVGLFLNPVWILNKTAANFLELISSYLIAVFVKKTRFTIKVLIGIKLLLSISLSFSNLNFKAIVLMERSILLFYYELTDFSCFIKEIYSFRRTNRLVEQLNIKAYLKLL